MKLKLKDMESFAKGLIPVTSVESKTRTGELNPEGLFSEKIFGIEGSIHRTKRYSYIDLEAPIIHPAIFPIFKRLDQRIISLFSTDEYFDVDEKGYLVESEDGFTGIPAFIKNFRRIKFKAGTEARQKLIDVIDGAYKDKTIFITKIPVIPPDFRPEYEAENGRVISDEINSLYVGIIRKASQIKGMNSGPIYDVLVYGMQMAINEHDKYVQTKISKKSGLIRNSLLGKRVDFSGRAVSTPGPDLDINQVGFPLRIAVPLFEPFLIHYFLYSKNLQLQKEFRAEAEKYLEAPLSVDTLKRLFRSLRKGAEIPEALYEMIFSAAQIVMKDRVVIAKRDPVLHDGSYRAFYPILVRGNVIQMCSLQVEPFNADFDGDQMGFFHPLSDKAQDEAKEKMTRLVRSDNSKSVMFEISKEMVLGLYTMTKNVKRLQSPIAVSEEDLEKAIDPYIPVKYRGHNTTMGRAIFNSAFPPSFEFIDTLVTKKVVNGLVNAVIQKYGEPVAIHAFSKLEKIGFKFSTIFGSSITLDDFEIPDAIKELKKKIPNSSPEEVTRLEDQMVQILKDHLKGTAFYDIIESGAGKGWGQPKQILIAKGMITDTKGNLLSPIEGSFSDGLKTSEYFQAAAGARKGMADRALNTADTGYFTRQLVYMLSPVEADRNLLDCKTKRTITIKLNNDSIGRLDGRYHVKGSKIVLFNKNEYKPGDIIDLRTPIFCESKKICFTCYGNLLKRHRTPYIGVLAGSKIGERGTQLIMRTFHTGGAATIASYDILGDILENDPLLSINKQTLKNYLDQTEAILYTKKPVKVTVDLDGYRTNDNIQYPNTSNSKYDGVWMNHIIGKVEFDDLVFIMALDYRVVVKGDFQKKGNQLIFTYKANEPILDIPTTAVEIKEQVNYIKRLLGGKMVYKDPSHLLMKILKVYGGSISDLDLVHMEVMCSQVLRDAQNPAIPARLGKRWNPKMANIKENVFSTSFIQGAAFENISKAIQVGLIEDPEFDQPTIFENILTGEKLI
jgi:hypothetical protein